jgi:hypothetical protein
MSFVAQCPMTRPRSSPIQFVIRPLWVMPVSSWTNSASCLYVTKALLALGLIDEQGNGERLPRVVRIIHFDVVATFIVRQS